MKRTLFPTIYATACLVLSSCQIYKRESSSDPANKSNDPTAEASADEKTECQPMKATVIVGPVILFHKWGARLSVPMKDMRTFLKQDGVSENDIFEPYYSYLSSFEKISSELQKDINEFLAKYPPGTKFTVITHSFGQMVALYTILTNGLESRVKRMIHFGGFANGQDKNTPFCFAGVCGDALGKMEPANNGFVKGFLETNAAKMRVMEQCSISSSADEKVVSPARAGDLPSSINVQLEDFKHDDLVEKPAAYQQMKAQCLLKSERCLK